MRRRNEHEIAWRPRIEAAEGKHARQTQSCQFLHIVPADNLPFIGEQRVDPRVVGSVTDRVVVEERTRFVQVVQYLRFVLDVRVEHVLRELERHAHRVAIVVVRDVVSPIDEARRRLSRMRHLPVEDVHHTVATIHLNNRRNERDYVFANVLDVGALVDGQSVRQLHERRRCPCLGAVNGARDVVDRGCCLGDLVGQRIVHPNAARIGQLGQLRFIRVHLGNECVRRDGNRDHLPPFFRCPDTEHAHTRRGLRQQSHVGVHFRRIGQLRWRAGNVTQDGLGGGHRLGRGQVVDEDRVEERLRGILADLLRVLLVNRLLGIASGLGGSKRIDTTLCGEGKNADSEQERRSDECTKQEGAPQHEDLGRNRVRTGCRRDNKHQSDATAQGSLVTGRLPSR